MRDLVHDEPAPLTAKRPPRAPRARRSGLVGVVLAAIAVVGLAGGVRYGVPVDAVPYKLSAGTFDVEVRGPGLLEAERHAVLGATLPGRVAALPVDVGDRVTKGSPVALLEATEAEIDLAHATEQARALAHQVTEAEAKLRQEEATLRRHRRELARQEELLTRQVISEGALDIALAERDAADARVAEAAARIARLTAELSGAHRLVDQRREALAQTIVKAPFDGVVVARTHEVGDVVSAGGAIVEIVDPKTLILSTRLDESQIARVAAGQGASVRFVSEPEREHAATVHRIGREVDPETREFVLELALGSLPANWAIGQRGSASVTIGQERDVLTLPTELVAHREGEAGAWVLQDGRARWRPVDFGPSADGQVMVLAGLREGDTALDGATLYRGVRVEARP